MMTTLRALMAAALVVGSFGLALGKLPPPDEKAKAAAAEAKAKAAAADEAGKAALARAEDRVVAHYIAEERAKGVIVKPQLTAASAPPAAKAKGRK